MLEAVKNLESYFILEGFTSDASTLISSCVVAIGFCIGAFCFVFLLCFIPYYFLRCIKSYKWHLYFVRSYSGDNRIGNYFVRYGLFSKFGLKYHNKHLKKQNLYVSCVFEFPTELSCYDFFSNCRTLSELKSLDVKKVYDIDNSSFDVYK